MEMLVDVSGRLIVLGGSLRVAFAYVDASAVTSCGVLLIIMYIYSILATLRLTSARVCPFWSSMKSCKIPIGGLGVRAADEEQCCRCELTEGPTAPLTNGNESTSSFRGSYARRLVKTSAGGLWKGK